MTTCCRQPQRRPVTRSETPKLSNNSSEGNPANKDNPATVVGKCRFIIRKLKMVSSLKTSGSAWALTYESSENYAWIAMS